MNHTYVYNMKDGTISKVSIYVAQSLVRSQPDTFTMSFDKFRKNYTPDLASKKKEELLSILDEKGIEYSKNITKKKILELLKEEDND